MKPVTESTPISDISTEYAYPFANVYGSPPNLAGWTGKTVYSVTRKIEERVWWSGHFRYFIPDTGSSHWNRAARLHLFGGVPTPELMWELTPWSWLIDWFSNVGDVVSNISPNAVGYPGLVDSYAMHSRKQTTVYSATSTVNPPASGAPYRWNSGTFEYATTETEEYKTRMGGGNPYGWNVQLPDLSAGQLAILAALGISRSKVK
jgi:hypothetical protein